MILQEIINKRTGKKLIGFEESDFEHEKPVKHYGDSFIVQQMVLRGVPKEELDGRKKPSKNSKRIFVKATLDWNEVLEKFKAVKIPDGLLNILGTNKKSAQIESLRGVVLTPDILMGFLIKAEKLGYTLSQYSSEHPQTGVDSSKMPFAYFVKENGEVQTFGNTELSDGQLKQAIQHRSVKVAKILDKDEEWHCFFTTFNSLNGEETWLGEKQPHYHYISNTFGISRTEVINQIKSKKYKLGNIPHIKLKEYGKQPH